MSWDRIERSAERGPLHLFWAILIPALVIFVALGVIGYSVGWFGEGANVAREEFGPRAMLEKYEWFIDQSNRIDKMDRDIALFQDRMAAIDAQYSAYGDKATWPFDIRTQYNTALTTAREDALAVVSQRNGLVQEYNAASEKFNWSPFKTRPDKPTERYQEHTLK